MTISNLDEVINTSDIIERIDELEAKNQPWIAGFNMPGFMPETEPCSFNDAENALEYIKAEIERSIEDEGLEVDLDAIKADPNGEFGQTLGKYHYWISHDPSNGLDPDEMEELTSLKSVAKQGEASPDWEYGETLIRDDYFTDYIEQLIEDCYPEVAKTVGNSAWPMRHITLDIEAAADEAKGDYIDIDFDGVTYWIRG